ncbi:MAG: hypothetical protein V4484_06965 [Pseudomonadota bacterium]
MQKILCVLLAAATALPVFAQSRASIGYANVADALAALKAKKDAVVSDQHGWTVIEDKAGAATWTFVPRGHPAYPALIKRALVASDGKSGVAITQLCHAGKTVCDKLVTEFDNLNKRAPELPVAGITVEQLGADAYRLVLTSFTSDSSHTGQQELMPKAKQLCGAKAPILGKFSYNLQVSFTNGRKDKGPMVLTQEISCE